MSYTKYYVYREKVSYDGGQTWEYTGVETPMGTPLGTYDTLDECLGKYRWVQSGYTCMGGDLYVNNIKQVTYDGGQTWINTSETSASTMVEQGAPGCTYDPSDIPDFLEDFTDYKMFSYNIHGAYIYVPKNGNVVLLESEAGVPTAGSSSSSAPYFEKDGHLFIGDYVEAIDNNAIGGSSCVEILIGKNVKYIGYAAFKTANVDVMVIPASVVEIGDRAFYSSKTVRFEGWYPPRLIGTPFDRSIVSIYVPASAINDYLAADGWAYYSSKIITY